MAHIAKLVQIVLVVFIALIVQVVIDVINALAVKLVIHNVIQIIKHNYTPAHLAQFVQLAHPVLL